MLCIGIQAQTNIANYTFASSIGTYVPLTGATTFTNSWDDEISAAVPLGGNFTFGAATYTACFINANGYITFGGAPASGVYTPLSTAPGSALGVVSAFGQDAGNSTAVGATPSISYMNIGGATGEFVVQYADHANYYGRTTERLNFQIRLNLATGAINVVYGSWTAPGSGGSGITSQVGIRGNTNTWTTNVNSLNALDVPVGTSCNWANAVTSNANNSSMLFSTGNANIAPSNGLTFTWAPPVNATLAPVRVFTAVTGITSNGATINWTAPTGATQYNVQYRTPGSCSWTSFSGNPVATNSATLTGLNPSTVYQVRVQSNDGANNAIWSHIPNAAGTGNGYSTTGTFSTTGLPTDLQTLALNAPTVSATGCYGSSIPVVIQLKNAGTTTLDFSTNNATILTSITGTNPQSFTTTVNTGTLAANATLNVTVTSTYNMSAAGVYTINASSTLATPDANTANNAMASVTRTATAATPAPYAQDFLAGTTPAGWVNTSSWSFAANHGVTNNGIYKNLYSSVTSASFNLLKLGALTGSESITFDFRVLNYNTTYPGTQVPPTGNWGNVQVQVSTDCGATFTTIGTIDNTTHTVTTQAFTNKGYSLASYAGQNVVIRILGTWVAGDYYVDMDNINIASCFAPTGVAASNITQTGSTIAWTAPLNGTPASYNYEIRTSGAAGSGTLGAISTGSVAAPTTSVSVSGLTPLTGYSVYVQSNCGGSDISFWTPVSTFTTLANCPVPSSVTISAITPTSAVITWTAGATETQWDMYYGVSPISAPTATTVPTSTTNVNTIPASPLTPSTAYSFYVRANCGSGNTSIWTPIATFTTPCLPPNVLTVNGSTRCGTGTTTLSATGDVGATLQWYANPTGGAPLASGNTFTTPTITTTTNYYVSAVGSLISENVGRASAASATGFLTTPNWGIVFNTTKNVLVNSATIYPVGTGSVTIALLDAAGTELASTAALAVTGTGTNSPVVVNLGFNVPAGNNFKIVLKAYTGITDLIRDGSPNAFPYNSTSGAISVTGGWNGTGVSASYYWFYNLNVSSGCESARSVVTATVTTPPVLTLSSPAAICAGSGIATLSVTSTLSDYDSYSWTPTTGLFSDAATTVPYTGTASTVYVKTNTDGVLNYNVNANNSISGCATAASTSVTVKQAPTSVSLTANPNPVCAGSTVSLSAIPNAIPVTVLTENFNGATNTWSTTNTSTGGTPANADWTLRNSPYTSNVGTGITSNDASQFYLADSDAQGSGGTTNVTLQSPAINTNGLTTLNLSFYHYYNYYIDDVDAKIEVSTNGTTWTTVQNYATGAVDIGTPTAFNAESINLDSYVGNATLYVRYNYSALYGYGWAIDNVKLSGTTINDYSYAWTSNPAGFTSAISNPTDAPTANTTYSVVITNTTTSCSNSSSVTVNVTALPTVTASASNASVCAGSSATLTAGGATNYTWTAGGNAASQVVTPSSASVYTVTGETSGCSNTATVSVGVTATPTVMAMTSNTAVCAGSSATLSAMGATNYTWTSGGNTSTEVVTPTGNSTYTVTGEDLGCTATATVSVNVNALPVVSAIASQTLLCDNGSSGASILTASTTATTYAWSDGATTMTTSVTPTLTTTYTVTVTELGCSADAFVTITVSNCNGVKELVANGINIYPNPTNGILNITISSELAGNTSIEVYDAIGKLAIKEILSGDTNTINLSKLENGMYVFKVINNNKTIRIGKVVKQ